VKNHKRLVNWSAMGNSRIARGQSRYAVAASILTTIILVSTKAVAVPVTYIGYVVTDVSLGGRNYYNAQITFTLQTDTKLVKTFAINGASGFLVDEGRATVQIGVGADSVKATFAPNQILVSLDASNDGIGFSSYIGGPNNLQPVYPLGLAEPWTRPQELTTAANVTGNAWSCIGFPPGSSGCQDPTGYPLKTDRGDFIIFDRYVAYEYADTGAPFIHSHSGTLNRATFSIVLGSRDD
jgi:hypothetical protein